MLEWTAYEQTEATMHIGKMHEEVYALIVERKSDGQAFTQFRGLKGADLYSDGARQSPNVETAKQICTVMMSAWRHKTN